LIPYHGEPMKNANELFRSKRKSGTSNFHAYATACVVEGGYRYTLALTYVRNQESTVAVLNRLLDRVQACGLKIKSLLLDRDFFTSHVFRYLQQRQIPFLVPVVIKGRPPKNKHRRAQGLAAFRRKPAGRYRFTWKVKKISVDFDVVVTYKSYKHRKTKRRRNKVLLYAAWRVAGAPVDIREQYRKRFGIEASFRQLGQARISTCTPDPILRLFFVGVGLLLRNAWVWLHFKYFADRSGIEPTLHLERLRFRRMLNWIDKVIVSILHDGSDYITEIFVPS
jgi:IS4 transposase